MRVVMIHAIAESIAPVKLGFGDEFPEAQVVNLLDEGLFQDFKAAGDRITPQLRRRMTQLICYAAEHGADAIGLACSFYAPVVDTARQVVDIPVVSSYGPVMREAVALGRRVGLIAAFPSTLAEAEFYLRQEAAERAIAIEVMPRLAPDLMLVMKEEGAIGLSRRLQEEVLSLAPKVDVIVLGQFSLAAVAAQVNRVSPVPALSAPHCSARRLKQLLAGPVAV